VATNESTTNGGTSMTQIENTGNSDDGASEWNFEFVKISTTEKLIKRMKKRWWNYIDEYTPTSQTNSTYPQTDNPTFSEGLLTPLFTGLRVALGGDKHTHK
jgi:hypothetical protein